MLIYRKLFYRYIMFLFQSKLFATICVLFVVIVEASQNSHESQTVHLRQKRSSPDFLGKIKSVSIISKIL